MESDLAHAIIDANFFGICLDDDIIFVHGRIADRWVIEGKEGMIAVCQF